LVVGLNSKNNSGAQRRSGTVLRAALMSGLATALIAGLAEPAAAYSLFGGPSYAQPQAAPVYKRKRTQSNRWQKPAAPAKPAEVVKHEGPYALVVSIKSQRVSLYGNGKLIDTSTISTGTPGHDTPQGVFTVIEKDRHHRSNIYSAAPMPYMQRITWSGVALHEGFVTGRPASHGCIRLPQAFAAKIWDITQLGARVIVAPEDVTPVVIEHSRLFAMKPKAAPAPVAAVQPDPVPTAKIRLATSADVTDATPVAEVEADPIAEGRNLTDLIRAEQAKTETRETEADRASMATAIKSGNLDKLKLATSGKEYPSRPGVVSVFISRATGKLYVRRGYWPIFETPVKIAQPETPFGTHVFTALEPKNDTELRWNVVSVPNEIKKTPALTPAQRKLGVVAAVREHVRPADPADVLSRITIPDEAVDRISSLMTPGASLIVSDMGISGETVTRGTDFIILTR
jgi:lipoprotein-anchoring transpeptidase ErfK/SrfK